jgi:hypothetical protein
VSHSAPGIPGSPCGFPCPNYIPRQHIIPIPIPRYSRYIRSQVGRLLGPYKRLNKLHGHLLDRSRSPVSSSLLTGLVTLNLLLGNERTNVQDFDTVSMVEVIAEVELVDVQGNDELGVVRRKVLGTEEGDGEVGTVKDQLGRLTEELEDCAHRKTFLLPNLGGMVTTVELDFEVVRRR